MCKYVYIGAFAVLLMSDLFFMVMFGVNLYKMTKEIKKRR